MLYRKGFAMKTKFKVLKNNVFIINLMWKSCKSYLLFSILFQTLNVLVSTLTLVWFIPTILSMISNNENFSSILYFVVCYAIAILIIDLLTTWYYQYRNPKELIIIHKNMRSMFYKKNLELDIAFFEDDKFYNQYIRASDEIDGRTRSVIDTLSSIFSNIISVATIIGLLSNTEIIVTLIIIILSVGTFFLNHIINKLQFNMSQEVTPIQKKFNYINKVFYDIKYSKELRIYELGKHFLNLFYDNSDKMNNIQMPYRKSICKIGFLNNLVNNLFYYGVLCYCIVKCYNKLLPAGQIVAFLNGITMLRTRINSLFSVLIEFKKNSLYIDNLLDYMELKSHIVKKNNSLIEKENIIDVEFRNLHFKYLNCSNDVLKNINISIPNKTHLAIVGYNGAGKSTLMKLILRLYDPEKGGIYFNGKQNIDYDFDSYKKMFSVVFQDFQIYALTIAENILMKKCENEKDETIVIDALDKIGLKEKVLSFPNGIHTYISQEYDENGCFLSGGELQRLALARSFVSDSKIIILDEPTTSLDPLAEKEILDLMMLLCLNKTVILISHKLSLVQNMDQILYIENGQIIEKGNHKSLMAQNGKYAEMYNAQAEKYRDDYDE